ncbi:MAG: hypothetical protein DRP09_20540, partial [Candidatus Thorarchaeota archaeon]
MIFSCKIYLNTFANQKYMSYISRVKKVLPDNLQLLARAAVFVVLAYAIIPAIFTFLSKGKLVRFHYNFFSFPAYTLILIVLFGVFNRRILRRYKVRQTLAKSLAFVLLSAVSFTMYFLVKFTYSDIINDYIWSFWTYTSFYFLGIIFIALAVFGVELFKKTFLSLILFSFAAYLFFMLTQIIWELWSFLARSVAGLTYHILKLFIHQVSIQYTSGDPMLTVKEFSIIIGPPCSGIESLSLFMGLFLLMAVYEQKNLNWKRSAI